MVARTAAILAGAVLTAGAATPAGGRGEEWIPLFNGKDLKDWKVKIAGYEPGENFGDTFRVDNGILRVCYDRYGGAFRNRFGHLFYKDELSDYRLRVEYRFVGDQLPDGPGWAFRNSGIMIHGQTPESMTKDQSFPVSIEVQLLGGKGTGERPTANLCTPGTNVVYEGKLYTPHVLNSRSKTYHGDQWVTVEVEARGGAVKHLVEGQVVLAYTDCQLDEKDGDAQKLLKAGRPKMLTGGTVSLQSESHPVEFRRVEWMRLRN